MRGLLHIIAPRRSGVMGESEGGGCQTCETLPLWPQCLLPRLLNFLVAPQLPQEALPGKGSWGSHPPCSKHRTGTGAQAPLMGSQKKSQVQLSPLPTPRLSILATCIRRSRAGTEEAERRGEKQRQVVRGALKSSEEPSDQISLECRVSQLLKSAHSGS